MTVHSIKRLRESGYRVFFCYTCGCRRYFYPTYGIDGPDFRCNSCSVLVGIVSAKPTEMRYKDIIKIK